jgi:group I intron endonuclease
MKITLNDIEDITKKGVYCITNLINKKIYIGSTTTNFKSRIRGHKKLFKNGKHHNIYLRKSYLKYGEENFEFSIIEIIENIELIRTKESYYIDFFGATNRDKGYNFSNCTSSPPQNEDIRNKISKTLTELHKNPGYKSKFLASMTLKCGKPSWNKGLICSNISDARKKMFDDIEVYDLGMNFFRRFSNPTEIEKFSKSDLNDLPIPDKIPFYPSNHTLKKFKLSYQKITNKVIGRQNIYRAIRNNKPYKGLFFKKVPHDSNIMKKIG